LKNEKRIRHNEPERDQKAFARIKNCGERERERERERREGV